MRQDSKANRGYNLIIQLGLMIKDAECCHCDERAPIHFTRMSRKVATSSIWLLNAHVFEMSWREKTRRPISHTHHRCHTGEWDPCHDATTNVAVMSSWARRTYRESRVVRFSCQQSGKFSVRMACLYWLNECRIGQWISTPWTRNIVLPSEPR